MARISRFAHLKPEILRLYQGGRSQLELYDEFPDVPARTIRDWIASLHSDSPRIPPEFPPNSPSGKIHAPQAPQDSAPPSLKVVSITDDDSDDLTEIAWIKRQCRRHARNPDGRSAIAIQALQVYLKALEVERKMSEDESSEFSKLTESERVERIARLLNLANQRKVNND